MGRVVVAGREGGARGEDVEIPWWTHGARRMQLWFPSVTQGFWTHG